MERSLIGKGASTDRPPHEMRLELLNGCRRRRAVLLLRRLRLPRMRGVQRNCGFAWALSLTARLTREHRGEAASDSSALHVSEDPLLAAPRPRGQKRQEIAT